MNLIDTKEWFMIADEDYEAALYENRRERINALKFVP